MEIKEKGVVMHSTDEKSVRYAGSDGAEAKLKAELEQESQKEFTDLVIQYLIRRCKESDSLAADICQEHKTLEKCYAYIYEKAREKLKGKSVLVREDVVYEWAEDYFRLDDKAVEENKAKEEEKRKKIVAEKRKQDAEQKGNNTTVASKPPRGVQKSNLKKNEVDGQMDFFSMIGI